MTKSKRLILIGLVLLFLSGLIVFLFSFNQEGFNGSRVKNPDAYLLDIERMNGTDYHIMELNEGDALQIHFETLKGSLNMKITAPDGAAVYSGKGTESTDFTVNIRKAGVYTIAVEASHAKGIIHIQLKKP
ncbi:MAG: PPC domain-containing protein [Firmicutes bacterium]|nr:PPC domain-containing protein [Bacillota bacterium]